MSSSVRLSPSEPNLPGDPVTEELCIKKKGNARKIVYVLMTLLVFMWGLEFIVAKVALETIKPLSLVCLKYSISLVLLAIVKAVADRQWPLKRRDIPVLFLCSLFGEVIYFASEYGAMAYLPVSVITIILAFVPCVSIVIEAICYKNRPTFVIVIGVSASVIGVALVIAADFREIFQGKYIGYLFAFGAVICWNAYNFFTKDLSERYKPFDLTLLQQSCAVIIVLPYAITNLPDPELISAQLMAGVLYLGIGSSFVGFLIYVKAIHIIGPTPCALFSNFLPVTTTFFGFILLHEQISLIQLLGGVIVIVSGTFVIREKGREDQAECRLPREEEGEQHVR